MKLYKLDRLGQLEKGNAALTHEIIDIFLSNLPADSCELSEACEAKDWDRVFFLAHKMKANIDLFNIESIQKDIRFVEKNAKSKKNLEELPGKIKFINEIIHSCAQQMREDFNY